eukprot:TRINITY_DN6169_c0_g2_i1.p1 TRINITY_DN6169_c0_g2~~TRINITY_DN6169_c0_g2_i1.p1  ORF type:complete len:508 (+),score=63.53 TRINITY_DN6169_c0_g2_i1:77-1525(+)
MPLFSELKKSNKLKTVPKEGAEAWFGYFYTPWALGLLWVLVVVDVCLCVAGAYWANLEVNVNGSKDSELKRLKIAAMVFLFTVMAVDVMTGFLTRVEMVTGHQALSIIFNIAAAVMFALLSPTNYVSRYAQAVLYMRVIRAFVATSHLQSIFTSLLWVDDEWHPGVGGRANPLDEPLLEDVQWSREQDNKYRGLREKNERTDEEENEMKKLEKGYSAFNEAGMAKIQASPPTSPKVDRVSEKVEVVEPRPPPKPVEEAPEEPPVPEKVVFSHPDPTPSAVPQERRSVVKCKVCNNPLVTSHSPKTIGCPLCRSSSPVSSPRRQPPPPPPYQAPTPTATPTKSPVSSSPPMLPKWDSSAVSLGSPGGVYKCRNCNAPLVVKASNVAAVEMKSFKCTFCCALTSVRSSTSPSRAYSRPASPLQMPPMDSQVMRQNPEWFEPPSRPASTDLEFRKQLGERLQQADSVASASASKRTPQHVSLDWR